MSAANGRGRTDWQPREAIGKRLIGATDQLLTAADVSRRWQVPVSQIYRLTRRGDLPTVRLGKYVRYAPSAIEDFEREGGCG